MEDSELDISDVYDCTIQQNRSFAFYQNYTVNFFTGSSIPFGYICELFPQDISLLKEKALFME